MNFLILLLYWEREGCTMTIQQMTYFEAVGRHQNIMRAADELHISQPTLSLAMQTLEQETGLNLLRLVTRGIACGIITGSAVLPESALAAIPIDGLVQHPAVFTKTGRQMTQDQRTLIAFLKEAFPAAPTA